MADRIITFDSIHHALKAEKMIRSAGLAADAISVPRHLSSDCGIALKIEDSIEDSVVTLMQENGINHRGIHPSSDQ